VSPLAKIIDVNTAEQGHGWTPLHLAARSGAFKVIEALIENGANVMAQVSENRFAFS
jgi:ankyrin repeat protein